MLPGCNTEGGVVTRAAERSLASISTETVESRSQAGCGARLLYCCAEGRGQSGLAKNRRSQVLFDGGGRPLQTERRQLHKVNASF